MRVAALLSTRHDAALRLALRLGEVIALRAGPREEEPLLRGALALGAARAVRLWHPVLGATDYLGLAIALAAAAAHLDCRLLLAGDHGSGAVGPAVAERLGLPHLCGVIGAAWEEGGQGNDARLLVERRTTWGRQRLRGPAEAVLCVAAGPPAQVGRGAAGAPIEVLALEDVGLGQVDLDHRRHLLPEPGAAAVMRPTPRLFPGVDALLTRLRQDGVLPQG